MILFSLSCGFLVQFKLLIFWNFIILKMALRVFFQLSHWLWPVAELYILGCYDSWANFQVMWTFENRNSNQKLKIIVLWLFKSFSQFDLVFISLWVFFRPDGPLKSRLNHRLLNILDWFGLGFGLALIWLWLKFN